MKRRTFLTTLTAAVAAPALPVGASMPSTQITQHFAKAKLLARCHDRASPQMFARLMQLDHQTAQGVFDMLQDRSVISKGLDGITRAMNPLNTNCVPNEAIRARDLAKLTSNVSKRIRKLAQDRAHSAEADVLDEVKGETDGAKADEPPAQVNDDFSVQKDRLSPT